MFPCVKAVLQQGTVVLSFEAVAALSGGGEVDVDTVQGSRKFVGVREGGK